MISLTRNRRNAGAPNHSRRRGAAAAEFAVCLPVLILLLMGMIEACSMVFLKQSLAVASYEGVGAGIRPDATAQQVRAACMQVLNDRGVRGGDAQIDPANLAALEPGEFFNVTVTAPTDRNGVIPARFYRGMVLRSSASMMKEF
ncbi:TadE-like protein [Pseudobythopirellula maris]|uniref:TadE-like protein n=1 Tax=Pseudobythopirellula maris TaxID=2527991 RepID=A0A5C5ZI89_9BACT|nr:TadE family protein [Pseudobythopirellula maris]TWT86835.1 TadE-like protein [Pseudobythopirellula maris]